MEHTTLIHEEHHTGGTKEIWRTFWILLVLTLVELAFGFWMIGMESHSLRLAVKGIIIILMMAKAFYIVAYFMHLKAEVKNLIMTIVVPLTLLLWAIFAFLYEGNSFKNNRNTHDRFMNESSLRKAPAAHHGENEKHELKEEKPAKAVEQ